MVAQGWHGPAPPGLGHTLRAGQASGREGGRAAQNTAAFPHANPPEVLARLVSAARGNVLAQQPRPHAVRTKQIGAIRRAGAAPQGSAHAALAEGRLGPGRVCIAIPSPHP